MRSLKFAVITAAIVGCGAAVAWAATPDEVVAQREDAMKSFGAGAKALTGFVRDNQGTIDDVKATTAKMKATSENLLTLFPEGTAVGVGKSAAKPEIWTNWADFQTKVKGAQDAIATLDAAAQSGDVAKVKAAFPEVGKACGACHETYRVKKS